MGNDFMYTTVEQQITKLKSQHLIFEDESTAKEILKTYGYYNIINGYRDPYIIRDFNGKKYSSDVTFEQIFSLFIFDHIIRDGVLLAMIDFEEHLKAIVADIIAEDFGSDYKEYLKRNNYRDRRVSDPRFSRNKILNSMIKTAEFSYTQPIRYYRETHGVIPPWILLKGVYFGTLVNLIKFFKAKQRDKLIYALYGNNISNEELDAYKDILSDTLFLCLEYRNLAAHEGRIYNYIPNSNVRTLTTANIKSGLPQLISALSFLKYKQPFDTMETVLSKALNQYCHAYPNDVLRIENAIGFEILKEKYVWANPQTHKFHSIEHCSGSQNCTRIPFDKAIDAGFTPCMRCCKDLVPTDTMLDE